MRCSAGRVRGVLGLDIVPEHHREQHQHTDTREIEQALRQEDEVLKGRFHLLSLFLCALRASRLCSNSSSNASSLSISSMRSTKKDCMVTPRMRNLPDTRLRSAGVVFR